MSIPAPTPLFIKQGETLRLTLRHTPEGASAPFDWSGYTGRLQARPSVDHVGTPYLNLTTANGGIVVNGTDIVLSKPAAEMLAVSFGTLGKAVYDLEMISPAGKVAKPFFGVIELIRAITK